MNLHEKVYRSPQRFKEEFIYVTIETCWYRLENLTKKRKPFDQDHFYKNHQPINELLKQYGFTNTKTC
jgi:hypothetical protein